LSTKYVKAVLDYLPVLTSPIDTLVLLAIAEHASDETRLAWPSVRSIVRRTRLCERAVHYALRRLEKLGVMSTTLGGGSERSQSEHHEPLQARVRSRWPPARRRRQATT
jgi:hypothetical protein